MDLYSAWSNRGFIFFILINSHFHKEKGNNIVSLIQSDPHCYSLTNTGKLRVKKSLPALSDRAAFVEKLMTPWLEAA